MIDDWLNQFEAALSAGDIAAATALFHADGYWRDLLTFTWNIKTMEGRDQIAAMLAACLPHTRPSGWRRVGEIENLPDGPTAWIAFDTGVATGTGRITLRDGLCHTLLTAMEDLKGHEERRGTTRPGGLTHHADQERVTWSEARASEIAQLGMGVQPHTLIIGAGQAGLALGARLRQLDVPTLIVEKNGRVGDSWRKRYRSLVLHDPVWYDHFPYLPFPDNWPVFCPKDKIGDWLEAYALIFELNVWTNSMVRSATRDPANGHWSVIVERGTETVTLTPRELVFATGGYGPPRMPDFPGASGFAGTLLHSSAYQTGTPYRNKRAVVIGSGSSAHDVAVDLWEAGAEVTMLQRGSSTVVRSETLMELGFELYSEAALARGITTDRADMIAAATPFALFAPKQRELYKTIRARDADFYAALEAAGFALDFGEDDSGQMMKALRTGSGFYIDVGASQLIIDGRIAVIAQDPIERLMPGGLRLVSGVEVEADVIVACAGYQTMSEAVASVVGREAADAIGPCWGLGSGVRGDPGPWLGELRNMWVPTAVDSLWFHGGNLALSRFYSRFVALQLKARLEGIPAPVYCRPVSKGKPCADPCAEPEESQTR